MFVGYASQRGYSDMELGLKLPALGTALACCVLFDASLSDLFPSLAGFVERDVHARARKLRAKLESDPSRQAAADFVAEVITRLDASRATE